MRRVAPEVPLVISVHGHDVQGAGAGSPAVRSALGHARLVLANSAGTATRSAALGAAATRVVHLGADLRGARPQAIACRRWSPSPTWPRASVTPT